jgi:protein-disulfide reductase (glutathione)
LKRLALSCVSGLFAFTLLACDTGPARDARRTVPRVEHEVADWNEEQVDWMPYEKAVEASRATGRPLLLVFHTTWCPHCINYSWEFHDPTVVRLSKDYVMVRVDRDERPELSNVYAVDGTYVPRTLVVESDGNIREDIAGGAEPYRYFLDEYDATALISVMEAGLKR